MVEQTVSGEHRRASAHGHGDIRALRVFEKPRLRRGGAAALCRDNNDLRRGRVLKGETRNKDEALGLKRLEGIGDGVDVERPDPVVAIGPRLAFRGDHDIFKGLPGASETICTGIYGVKDGKFWPAAGVTAGIDLGLALIEDDFGPEVAIAVARELVVYMKRPGGQEQYSAPMQFQLQARSRFADLFPLMHAHLDRTFWWRRWLTGCTFAQGNFRETIQAGILCGDYGSM
jgi:hypothetical protein